MARRISCLLLLSVCCALLLAFGRPASAAGRANCHSDDDPPATDTIPALGVLNSSGCGKTPLASGVYKVTVNGTERHYIVRVPSNYNPTRAYRFILAFHWNGGTMEDVATKYFYYGMVLYHSESSILISPQGIENGWKNNGGEDIEFVRQIIKTVDAGLCVNQHQRFSMGFSYGASMTHSVACSLGSQFRAVSVLSGGEYSGCEGNGTAPVAYFSIHGIRDTVVPIEKGREIRDVFVKANGCTPQSPPEPKQGDLNHITTKYTGCSAGHPLVFIAFDDGHTPMPSDGSIMQNSTATWMPAATWSFFSQFE